MHCQIITANHYYSPTILFAFSEKFTFVFAYIVDVRGIMGRKFTWEYRWKHTVEFPYVCNICSPKKRRFKTKKDQQTHNESQTKRHDPNFVGL